MAGLVSFFQGTPRTGLLLASVKKKKKTPSTKLGVDSPFFSTIVLLKNQLFPQGFGWFCRKKDAWKEWGRYP